MPSTLVHLAFGGLVGAALLDEEYDAHALGVVLLAAALPDLDSFAALVATGTHRALLHNLIVPLAVGGVLAYDTRRESGRRRDHGGRTLGGLLRVRARNVLGNWPRTRDGRLLGGRLRARWGDRGVRLAWVALAAFVAGGVFPDLFTNGVNVFYPLHDAFYAVDGELLLSNHRGVVQTFVELASEGPARSTDTVVYTTGVNPSVGSAPENVERIFPVARGGWQLMVILTSTGVLGARLWADG